MRARSPQGLPKRLTVQINVFTIPCCLSPSSSRNQNVCAKKIKNNTDSQCWNSWCKLKYCCYIFARFFPSSLSTFLLNCNLDVFYDIRPVDLGWSEIEGGSNLASAGTPAAHDPAERAQFWGAFWTSELSLLWLCHVLHPGQGLDKVCLRAWCVLVVNVRVRDEIRFARNHPTTLFAAVDVWLRFNPINSRRYLILVKVSDI